MEDENLNHIVYSKNVVEFVTVANEYCSFVEGAFRYSPKDVLEKSRKLLPLLYLKATLLPKVEKQLESELEKFVSEIDYNILVQKWAGLLGENDSYREIFDPGTNNVEDHTEAFISECILDVYQDLKEFITSYSLGNEEVMNDSLSECTYNFEEFWGQRLVNVLRPIHMLLANNVDLDQKEEIKYSSEEDKSEGDWVDGFFNQFRDENLT